MNSIVVLFSTLSLTNFLCITFAFDPTPLQDFCVATTSPGCKDPKTVTAEDFFYSGLNKPANTSNPYRAGLSVARIPGLNTLGLTMARLDFLPNGLIPPHYHPRGTELLTVLEGSIEVGFVTSYPEYRSFSKVLKTGDVFVVPVGLAHFQRGVGASKAVVLSAVNSENPGIVEVARSIFGAKPPIDADYISRSFLSVLDKKTVGQLQSKFSA